MVLVVKYLDWNGELRGGGFWRRKPVPDLVDGAGSTLGNPLRCNEEADTRLAGNKKTG